LLFVSKVPSNYGKKLSVVLIDTLVRIYQKQCKRASERRREVAQGARRRGGRLRLQRTWNGSPSLCSGKLPGIPANAMPLISLRELPVLTDASSAGAEENAEVGAIPEVSF